MYKMYKCEGKSVSSYLFVNINDLGAIWPLVLKFTVIHLCLCFHFIKYCKEIPGEICVRVSSHEY